jgi:Tfp pilus assembly protein PilO
MQGTDKNILIVIPLIALLLAFYLMVLGPKRQEASKLDEDIQTLQSQIDTQEQTAQYAEQAREDFPKYYGSLVVLGKAVPEEADSASLLVQLNGIANKNNVVFESLAVNTSGGDTSAAAAPAAGTATTPPSDGTGTDGTAPETTPPAETTPASSSTSGDPTAQPTTPAVPTETTAANLPIGATVGAAGLPTLPYTLTFSGSFFDVADFFAGVDQLIDIKGKSSVVANGRLVTVDGFVLKGGREGPNPILDTALSVTTYITPPEQGLTGGATPGGPPLGSPATTPTSAPTTAGVAP